MSWDGRIRADARHLPIADGCVQCVVTSPPYWGLRDYGHAPLIWDGDPDCEHAWGVLERTPWANAVPGPSGLVKNTPAGHWKPKEHGQWCYCGAWRGSFGLEPTPELYVAHSVQIFREVWRVLEDAGTLWLNLGDCYATGAGAVGNRPGGGKQGDGWTGPRTQPSRLPIPGLKPKDLVGIPWRVAFALQADGWYLRSDIIWSKKNCMPESVLDRPTRSHESIFLLSKSERYFYDADAIREPSKYAGPNGVQKSPHAQGFGRRTRTEEIARQDKQRGHSRRHNGFNDRWDGMSVEEQCSMGRNKRDVWHIGTQPYHEAHYATFPEEIPETCIKAGSRPGDVILDPFFGSGTVGKVAERLSRRWIGCDLGYQDLQLKRMQNLQKVLV